MDVPGKCCTLDHTAVSSEVLLLLWPIHTCWSRRPTLRTASSKAYRKVPYVGFLEKEDAFTTEAFYGHHAAAPTSQRPCIPAIFHKEVLASLLLGRPKAKVIVESRRFLHCCMRSLPPPPPFPECCANFDDGGIFAKKTCMSVAMATVAHAPGCQKEKEEHDLVGRGGGGERKRV